MKDDGTFVLHTIGNAKTTPGTDTWIDIYIFQNGVIPSLTQISDAVESYFVIEENDIQEIIYKTPNQID